MKKIKFGLLGLVALSGFALGGIKTINPVFAEEPEVVEESEPEKNGTVIVELCEHGTIETDIKEGKVGDVCTITAKHDILYKVSSVSVNGVDLIEDENVSGKFCFALVEGENKISARFAIDEELCGELTGIVQQAEEKDWTNLFTFENIITVVKWILDGGILIVVARYFIKDKKLEKKVEDKVESTINGIIPESTKQAVIGTVENVISPLFSKIEENNVEITDALKSLTKCVALMQEGTSESKIAIIDELSNLKIGDKKVGEEVKKYLQEVSDRLLAEFKENMATLSNIQEKNKNILNEETEEKENTYDGTSI